ncbi:MAG: tol-pal system-associated acyl-CoA thioesterase [Rhizobacter sp.]
MTAPSPHHYAHTLRIYWEDTDAGGVVFYANYLKFFERARTEWLRSLGFAQEEIRTQTGAIFIVSQTSVRYLRPARLDDLLSVTVQVKAAGQASMHITQVAWRGDERLAEGDIRIGCVDAESFRPRRIPEHLLQAMAEQVQHLALSPLTSKNKGSAE